MNLRLPPLGLPLRVPWDGRGLDDWAALQRRVTRLENAVWAGPTVQKDAEMLRMPLREGREDDVLSQLTSPRAIRALTWLWVEVNGDCRDTVTVALLNAIVGELLTRGSVHFLARLYFEQYDRLSTEELATLRELLRVGAKSFPESSGIVGALSVHGVVLLDPEAPMLIAREAKSKNLSYSEAVRKFGVSGFLSGRFGELVRQFIVLEELISLPMDVHHTLFNDVREQTLQDALHTAGLLFGHAILATMIDRVGQEFPSGLWKDTVFTIAGDPRRTHTESYRKWWDKLGDDRIAKATSWLAKEELDAFLAALERFAYEDENGKMSRMFPPRKRLLEGLLRENQVASSRLYLGRRTRTWLRGEIGLAHVPTLSDSASTNKALIYLDCGDFHLVEGSHDTQLWVYLLKPPASLTDHRQSTYTYRALTAGAAETFDRNHNLAAVGKRFNTTHAGKWQFKFLEYLAGNQIYVDPEAVLSPSDYRRFRDTPGYRLSVDLGRSLNPANGGK